MAAEDIDSWTESAVLATGDEVALGLTWTVNKATSGDDTAFSINKIDTASPGVSRFVEYLLGGVSVYSLEQDGHVDHSFIAPAASNHAMEVLVAAGGFGDVKGIEIAYTSGAIANGDSAAIYRVAVNQATATGGTLVGYGIAVTEQNGVDVFASGVGPGIIAIGQQVGAFANMGSVLNAGVDALTAFTTSDPAGPNNVNMFVANSDTVIIGDVARFTNIPFILETGASGAGVKPTFEFSTGVGTWTLFSPSDGTNGFRMTGAVGFALADIPTWAVGAGSEFLIRITRTQNTLTTPPKEDLVQISATVQYGWGELADIRALNLNLSADGATIVSGVTLLLPLENDAVTPTLAFGDGDSGFYETSDDVIAVAIAGVTPLTFRSSGISTFITDGPTFLSEAATATNPVFAFASDDDTGVGRAGVNQLSLIAGAIEGLRINTATTGVNFWDLTPSATGVEVILASAGSDTNIDATISAKGTLGEINFSPNGSRAMHVGVNLTSGDNASSYALRNVGTSLVVPTLVPRQGDTNSGIGSRANDVPVMIAGGVTAQEWAETASHVIVTHETDPAITAGVTQTQAGGFQLLSSRNVVTTVATLNDTVVMPLAATGIEVIVVNRGANIMQIFPGVGDDIGTGVDTVDTIAVGANKHYFADDATTWSTL